ncbi:Dihydroorotate dehydrogenase (quinone), mitochondrial [Sporothrix curviconia]|uniref:Dihydroorotate dehydrogenase (Quinone), mitochondrial n=1 Tax=Sporothrix curviconia TaxID=1260050 RepID=A0ABP0AWD9_9PEZI
MGYASPQIAAQVAEAKAKSRAYTRITSPSAAPGIARPLQRRVRDLLSKQAVHMALAAKGITRRVTRSMTRKQALLDTMLSSPSSSARTASQQLLADKAALISQSATPLPSPLPSPSPSLSDDTAGTIMIFNDTNNSIQTAHIKYTGDNADENSPIFIPQALRTVVPDMGHYGRQNCGQHGGTAAKSNVPVTCRDCRTIGPVAGMHCLSCGHVLCRSCLKEVVWAIDANLHNRRIWDAIKQCMYDAFYEETIFAPAKVRTSKKNKNKNKGTNKDSKDKSPAQRSGRERAWDIAGMTCCARLMQLDRHMACLNANTAAVYWLAHDVLRHPPELAQDRCGWPDCGQILAPSCFFVNRNQGMYFCMRCRGNSKFINPSTLIPARSCNEKGL